MKSIVQIIQFSPREGETISWWLSLWHYKTGLYENSMNISELLVSPPRGENCILLTMLFNFLIKKVISCIWQTVENVMRDIINPLKYIMHDDKLPHMYIYIYNAFLFVDFIISSTETESKGIIKYVNRIYLNCINLIIYNNL